MLLRDELDLDNDGFGEEEEELAEGDVEMRRDNREILDNNNAQKLSYEAIE